MERYWPGVQNTTHPGPWKAGPYSFGKVNSMEEGEFIAIAHHMEDLKGTFHSHMEALAGSPGVYYHMRHRTELQEKPHFYAGKAHHLSGRGGDKRIIDKNLVIFIRKKNEKKIGKSIKNTVQIIKENCDACMLNFLIASF